MSRLSRQNRHNRHYLRQRCDKLLAAGQRVDPCGIGPDSFITFWYLCNNLLHDRRGVPIAQDSQPLSYP